MQYPFDVALNVGALVLAELSESLPWRALRDRIGGPAEDFEYVVSTTAPVEPPPLP